LISVSINYKSVNYKEIFLTLSFSEKKMIHLKKRARMLNISIITKTKN